MYKFSALSELLQIYHYFFVYFDRINSKEERNSHLVHFIMQKFCVTDLTPDSYRLQIKISRFSSKFSANSPLI